MFPDIPNNFPDAHACSLPNTTYLLVAQHYDTIDEVGAVLVDPDGVFSGWVAKGDEEDILNCNSVSFLNSAVFSAWGLRVFALRKPTWVLKTM